LYDETKAILHCQVDTFFILRINPVQIVSKTPS
jgi:hypothetical protein